MTMQIPILGKIARKIEQVREAWRRRKRNRITGFIMAVLDETPNVEHTLRSLSDEIYQRYGLVYRLTELFDCLIFLKKEGKVELNKGLGHSTYVRKAS